MRIWGTAGRVPPPKLKFLRIHPLLQTPFEVGDEIHFFHTNKQVEGIVIDIGWYRTQIRRCGICCGTARPL